MGAVVRDAVSVPVLLVIKLVVYIYTLLTLPIYFLLCQPWKKWRLAQLPVARPLDPKDPGSAYVRTLVKEDNPFTQFQTLDQIFRHVTNRYRDRKMFGARELLAEHWEESDGRLMRKVEQGEYHWMTYGEAYLTSQSLARSLLASGVRPRQPIVIFSETRMEWMLLAQGCFQINVPFVGLFSSLGDEGIVSCLEEMEASLLVTSASLFPKVKALLPKLSTVRQILYFESLHPPDLTGVPESVKVHSYRDFLLLGDSLSKDVEGEQPSKDDTAFFIYTSGSTGVPKGVVMTHSQILSVYYHVYNTGTPSGSDEVVIAYLPQAHVFEFCTELALMWGGVKYAFSSPFTLTSKSTAIRPGDRGDIELARPSMFLVVPLVLEKFRKSVLETLKSKGRLAELVFRFSLEYKKFWHRIGFSTPIIDRLVFAPLRQPFGGRVKYIATGGAPMSQETFDFCRLCLGVELVNFYGQSETCGCGTFSNVYDLSGNTAGYGAAGAYLRIVDWKEGGYSVHDRPHPRGELLVGGDCVATGYYRNAELTREVFLEEDGVRWVRTGDIVVMERPGRFRIIDRKKDLVKLQSGEYISLGKVEAFLKSSVLVDNVWVTGDGIRDYLVAVVVPNQVRLSSVAHGLGLPPCLQPEELARHPRLVARVQEDLAAWGRRVGLKQREIPQRIALVLDEWLPESGLVTAALKLRRRQLSDKYGSLVAALYKE